MNDKEKRARFRALAQQDRIQTGSQFAKQIEQPCFAFLAEAERTQRRAAFQLIRRELEAHK